MCHFFVSINNLNITLYINAHTEMSILKYFRKRTEDDQQVIGGEGGEKDEHVNCMDGY